MKLVLNFLLSIQKLSGELASELQQLVVRLNTWGSREHTIEGAHTNITVTGFTFNGTTQTTVGAAGAATALPANPTGYFVFTNGTTEVVVPFYTKA